jgi:hypothetical protein
VKRPVLTRMLGRSLRVLPRTDGGNVTTSSASKPRLAHLLGGRGSATLKALTAECLFCG